MKLERELSLDGQLQEAIDECGLEPDDVAGLLERAKHGDQTAAAAVERFADALANLIQILNAPLDLDAVVVEPFCRDFLERTLPKVNSRLRDLAQGLSVRVEEPQLGESSRLLGAATEALNLITHQAGEHYGQNAGAY